jgi:NhaA family Na+:H+ antiporter
LFRGRQWGIERADGTGNLLLASRRIELMATEPLATSGVTLDPPVNPGTDHILGPHDAPISLVEYGSYACPHCRAAHERIVHLRDEFGDRLLYAFRHRPVPDNPLARRAAELAERAGESGRFWKAHVALMTRSPDLTEEDLREIQDNLGIANPPSAAEAAARRAVDRHVKSADASGVIFTPTFFINRRRYDGPWDESSISDALLGSLGYRVRAAALDFANWTPSTGIVLLLATLLAVLLSNSAWGNAFTAFWQTEAGLDWGGSSYRLPLLSWVNDGLLTIFFLVVGLEIKREFTVGHLATRQLAAMPVAAAIGGMIVPALLYLLLIPPGAWQAGWGIPIATDTAFAVALIATMGARVPIELRIFLTAAAILDDIVVIVIIAIFYAGGLDFLFLALAAGTVLILFALNRAAVYRVTPYALVGVLLWFFIHEGGVHATLAGVLLALFIPTRPSPHYQALMAQSDAIITHETQRGPEEMRHMISAPSLRALDAIHDRLESPAARLLRHVEVRSSYLVLPIFALANAGVVLDAGLLEGRGGLVAAIIVGLMVGKPVGLLSASYFAVRLGLAEKPREYSWAQVLGAGFLGGIGFTMSLFIANLSFPVTADFNAAKIAIFAASAASAAVGGIILWLLGTRSASA